MVEAGEERVIQARMVEESPAVTAPAQADAPSAANAPAAPSAPGGTSAAPAAQVSAAASSARFGHASWMGNITHYGVTLEAGLPDGASLNAMFRPWYFLRGHLGYANNSISHGVKGGVTLVAFNFPITPALQLEMGKFFDGRGGLMTALPDDLQGSLAYNFYSANVGLEIGSQNRFLFFTRVGLSRVNAKLGGMESTLQQAANSNTLEADDGKLRVGIPSVKAGFAIFFL